jgi:hypothetical protein
MSDDAQHSKWLDLWEKILPGIVGGVIAGLFAIAGSYFAGPGPRRHLESASNLWVTIHGQSL